MAGGPRSGGGPRIEVDHVTRRFGAVVAVTDASVAFEPGAIHAVVGENGAGKSTLLKMAAGVVAPSSGAVRIDGAPLEPATPGEAIRRGVGMVHQHFMLVGAFRAIENLVLGAEPVLSLGRLDLAAARARATEIAEASHLEVPLDRVTEELTVGQRQRLEILRVLYRGAKALLLDEPTAVLSPVEAVELYATLRRLADTGSTIAVVTHRLDEVRRFADRVTVMRRGAIVASGPADRGSDERAAEERLTRAIMGGEPPPAFEPPQVAVGAPVVLDIAGVQLDEGGRRVLDGVDLAVRAGEIVGVAGVEGNGQRELVHVLSGLARPTAGTVTVAGRDVHAAAGVKGARAAGIGAVQEDRQAEGLVLDASVGDNLVLGELGAALDERTTIARRIAEFDVRPADARVSSRSLSGGNQQKIVVARALDRLKAGALVLAQPTRGVDVGAAATIHGAIGAAAERGIAVLLVSADLGELKRVAHRLVVLRRGKIVAELARDADDTVIGRAMLGLA